MLTGPDRAIVRSQHYYSLYFREVRPYVPPQFGVSCMAPVVVGCVGHNNPDQPLGLSAGSP